MTRLHDDQWRATRDLIVPTHPGEEHIGVSVPEGDVIPEELRDAVAAMESPARGGRGEGG